MIMARCPWYIAGPLLGLVIIGLRAAVNRPLGALGGYIDIVNSAAAPRRVGFSTFLLIGIVAGGAVYATVTRSYAGTWSYQGAVTPWPVSGSAAVILVSAGLTMGIGARIAGGCTSGHGLSGTSLGSPASLVATMTFVGTAVAVANVFAWLFGVRP